jgi:hypothetical protein
MDKGGFMGWFSETAFVGRILILAAVALAPMPAGAAEAAPESKTAIEKTIAGLDGKPLAWQRTDKYVAPDFEGFFPDDPEGGKKLDRLFRSRTRDSQAGDEILGTVRSGLRRTTQHRTLILQWLGNRCIWNVSPQDPRAIEIMYHAADFRKVAEVYGTRHYAVYFGLSVVQPKTPAILRTLAELCMRVDDPNDLERVAWGARAQREELLKYIRPFIKSKDADTRVKAEVVEKILNGQLKAFVWAAEQAKKRAKLKYSDELPRIKQTLLRGSSHERRDALMPVTGEQIALIMDDSFLPAFASCAEDADPQVRKYVAMLVGQYWIWSAQSQNPKAIDLMMQLSKDSSREVRYNAVYFGLSTVRNKDEKIVRRLLEMAFDDREWNLYRRIVWGLQRDRAKAVEVLRGYLHGDDPARTRAAREVYKDMTGQEPPAGPAIGTSSQEKDH